MKFPIDHPSFDGETIHLSIPSFFSGVQVIHNNQPLVQKRNIVSFRTSGGKVIEMKLKPSIFDSIPKVEIGGELITLAPPIKWYEYIFIIIPLGLLAVGGAIGGAIGMMAVLINGRLFRSDLPGYAKYFLAIASSAMAWVVYLILAMVIRLVFLSG